MADRGDWDPYVNQPVGLTERYPTARIADEVCEAMRARIEELERQLDRAQREIDQAQETLRGFQLPPHALKGAS